MAGGTLIRVAILCLAFSAISVFAQSLFYSSGRPSRRSVHLRAQWLDLRPPCRALPTRSASSTVTCWPQRLRTLLPCLQIAGRARTQRDWAFYRDAAKNHSLAAHRSRISAGTLRHCEGRAGQGHRLDVWDIVAVTAHRASPTTTFRGSTSSNTRRMLRTFGLSGIAALYRHRQLHQRRQNRDRAQ